ncbi:MAG: hypothetical protein G01um101429_243 [Parcubacteria group bacterium Gr01-1014_29]|nr:MAG: hypothetical protein G01um101429_243 [Parcubacteria group bacterium Gr01-1014_29]
MTLLYIDKLIYMFFNHYYVLIMLLFLCVYIIIK